MALLITKKTVSKNKKINKRKKKNKNLVSKNLKNVENVPKEEVESDQPITKNKWINKTRVLVFGSRGLSYTQRHLMIDLKNLMPHSKSEPKLEKKENLFVINEMCEMKNCNKCLYFENRKKSDLYMWMSNVPAGPSAKFLVENIHTMMELKMTGNCLKGSRPLLSFDKTFESSPHLRLIKELFIQIFSVPYCHPKSKPFVDHVITFCIFHDEKILFRNYQIVEENAELVEIGPRMTLNLIKIFKNSFSGETLFNNPHYITPNSIRSQAKEKKKVNYLNRIISRKAQSAQKPDPSLGYSEINDVFDEK